MTQAQPCGLSIQPLLPGSPMPQFPAYPPGSHDEIYQLLGPRRGGMSAIASSIKGEWKAFDFPLRLLSHRFTPNVAEQGVICRFLLDQEHQLEFFPGDHVSGFMWLYIGEPLKCQTISLSMFSGEQSYWVTQNGQNGGSSVHSERQYVEHHEVDVLSIITQSTGKVTVVQPGQYCFRFETSVSANAPSTFNAGNHNWIATRLELSIAVPGFLKANHEFARDINVRGSPRVPPPQWISEPGSNVVSKTQTFAFCSGNIQLTMELPTRLLSAVEELPVRFTITNSSKSRVEDVRLKLGMMVTKKAHRVFDVSSLAVCRLPLGLSVEPSQTVSGTIPFCPARLLVEQERAMGSLWSLDYSPLLQGIDQSELQQRTQILDVARRSLLVSHPSDDGLKPKWYSTSGQRGCRSQLIVVEHYISLTCVVPGRTNPKVRLPVDIRSWPGAVLNNPPAGRPTQFIQPPAAQATAPVPPLCPLGPMARVARPLYYLEGQAPPPAAAPAMPPQPQSMPPVGPVVQQPPPPMPTQLTPDAGML